MRTYGIFFFFVNKEWWNETVLHSLWQIRLLVTTEHIVMSTSLSFSLHVCFFFFSCLHLLMRPVAPGLSLPISPRLYLPLIHSQGEIHLGPVVWKHGSFIQRWGQGFIPSLVSGLEEAWFHSKWHENYIVFTVPLIESNILRIDFSWFNHATLRQGRSPAWLPWIEYSFCRHRENS